MTRKDYVLLAEALKRARYPEDGPEEFIRSWQMWNMGVDQAARVIASDIAQDNPKFDVTRFLAACGVA